MHRGRLSASRCTNQGSPRTPAARHPPSGLPGSARSRFRPPPEIALTDTSTPHEHRRAAESYFYRSSKAAPIFIRVGLELYYKKVPTLGSFSTRISKAWKISARKFQALEVLLHKSSKAVPPRYLSGRAWKFRGRKFQSLEFLVQKLRNSPDISQDRPASSQGSLSPENSGQIISGPHRPLCAPSESSRAGKFIFPKNVIV